MKTNSLKSHIATLLLTFIVTLSAKAQNVSATITKLASSDGMLMIELVDKSGNTVDSKAIELKGKECEVTFENVSNGTYAIRYYHDENKNGKMDTGTFGIPKEGYGFSNNARGFMGPPDFEDMLFDVEGDVSMTLKTVN